jgi:hypothetical protein
MAGSREPPGNEIEADGQIIIEVVRIYSDKNMLGGNYSPFTVFCALRKPRKGRPFIYRNLDICQENPHDWNSETRYQ